MLGNGTCPNSILGKAWFKICTQACSCVRARMHVHTTVAEYACHLPGRDKGLLS